MTWQQAIIDAWRAGVRAGLLGKASKGEAWAESDPALPQLETRAVAYAQARWRRLQADVFALLGLARVGKAPIAREFRFDLANLPDLLALGERFTRDTANPDGPLLRAFWTAWARGYVNAARELDRDVEIGAQRVAINLEIRQRGLQLVRNTTARALRDRIAGELASGAYDGMNPVNVAARLRARFDAGDYDWERLARTEIATAQSEGKRRHYQEAGITHVDYVTAGDDRVSEICTTLSERGPYRIEVAPVPGRDSHPNCRCTLVARIPD